MRIQDYYDCSKKLSACIRVGQCQYFFRNQGPSGDCLEGEDLTVWEFIDGTALDQDLGLMAHQRTGIKLELSEFILKLWEIPISMNSAVGSLCSTHEL